MFSKTPRCFRAPSNCSSSTDCRKDRCTATVSPAGSRRRPRTSSASRRAANGLVSAQLGLSREGRAQGLEKRFDEFRTALTQRLEADSEIAEITFADRFPGQEGYARLEMQGAGEGVTGSTVSHDTLLAARPNMVANNFFNVFEVPVVAGRGFTAADVRPDANAVMVDDTFVRHVGGNVLGRRVRYARSGDDDTTMSPWYEIVGVVPAFSDKFTSVSGSSAQGPLPRMFHPARPGEDRTSTLVIRLTGSPSPQLAPRLRQIAATVDPGLRVEGVQGVVDSWEKSLKLMQLVAVAIIVVTVSVLLLSAAGIYAMMSFTVARRRREIGIRAALGADARRMLTGGNTLLLMPSVVAVMSIVGRLFAAVAPARRGLAVQPVEALR